MELIVDLLCRIDTIGIDFFFFPLTLLAITLEQYSFNLGSFQMSLSSYQTLNIDWWERFVSSEFPRA